MQNLKDLINSYHWETIQKLGESSFIEECIADYQNQFGIMHTSLPYNGVMNPDVGMVIADAQDKAVHAPDDSLVKAAYQQLTVELIDQYRFLRERLNLTIEPFFGTGQPYANSYEMINDVLFNNHFFFFMTQTEDSAEFDLKHALLEPTGLKVGDFELVANDVLRIVHDIFGHTIGNSFGPKDEDKAWLAHAKMFTPLARAALTAETRSQNAWVNFGPHMRDTKGCLIQKGDVHYLAPTERPYAEQKMVLLPEVISGVSVYEEHGVIKVETIRNWHPLLSPLTLK